MKHYNPLLSHFYATYNFTNFLYFYLSFFSLQGTRSTVCLITSARHSTLSIILVDFCIKKIAESKIAHGTCDISIKQPNSFIFSLYCFHICLFDKGINVLMESVIVIQCHAPSWQIQVLFRAHVCAPTVSTSFLLHTGQFAFSSTQPVPFDQRVGQYSTTAASGKLFSLCLSIFLN